jgi:hypothetical protein
MVSAQLFGSLGRWTPELILSIGAMGTVFLGVFLRGPRPALAIAWLSLLSAAVSLWIVQGLPFRRA